MFLSESVTIPLQLRKQLKSMCYMIFSILDRAIYYALKVDILRNFSFFGNWG